MGERLRDRDRTSIFFMKELVVVVHCELAAIII